jgi:hypothetical protein
MIAVSDFATKEEVVRAFHEALDDLDKLAHVLTGAW